MKLAILTLLILAAVSAALYATDLTALARREKARRDALRASSEGAPSRSYDDRDLERYRRESGGAAEPARGRIESPRPRGEREPPGRGRDLPREEDYWRRELSRHRREMDRIDASIRRLAWRLREKRSRRRPGDRVVDDPTVSLLEDSIQSLREDRRRLDEFFRERARKSRALPGWIR